MWSKLLVLCGLLSSSGASILTDTDALSCHTIKHAYGNKCGCSDTSGDCFSDYNPNGVNYMRLDLSSLLTDEYVYDDGSTEPYLDSSYVPLLNTNRQFHGISNYSSLDSDVYFMKMQTMKNFLFKMDAKFDAEIESFCDSTKGMCTGTSEDTLIDTSLYNDTFQSYYTTYEDGTMETTGDVMQQLVTLVYSENGEPQAPVIISLNSFQSYDPDAIVTWEDEIAWFNAQTNLIKCFANATGHCLDQSIIEGTPPPLVAPARRRLKQVNPEKRRERTKQLEAKRDLAREQLKGQQSPGRRLLQRRQGSRGGRRLLQRRQGSRGGRRLLQESMSDS